MDMNKEGFFDEKIKLTEKAVIRINAILSGEDKSDHALRVSV